MKQIQDYFKLYQDLTIRTTNQDTKIINLEQENILLKEENEKLKKQLQDVLNRLNKLEEVERKRTN